MEILSYFIRSYSKYCIMRVALWPKGSISSTHVFKTHIPGFRLVVFELKKFTYQLIWLTKIADHCYSQHTSNAEC